MIFIMFSFISQGNITVKVMSSSIESEVNDVNKEQFSDIEKCDTQVNDF